MASIRRVAGRWQVQVARQGVRKSKSFENKSEAKDWAAKIEHEILRGVREPGSAIFRDVLDRYARTVSPTKRGARWEIIRLERLKLDKLAELRMNELRPGDFADWRDRRLQEVAPNSVIREMGLLSSVLTRARREWGLIEKNPLSDVVRPRPPEPRDRRVTQDEIDALLEHGGGDLGKTTGRAVHAFLFAIETAMRAGEILALRNADIDGPVARLTQTKNGRSRDVPLSSEALRLWGQLPGDGFELDAGVLDTTFRRVRDRAEIKDLHFHDSRHEAITRLADRVDVLDLARMVGHTDLNQLRTYYNKSAADIAKLLD